MGFKKGPLELTVISPDTKPEVAAAPPVALSPKEDKAPLSQKQYSSDEKRAHGQVRMHGIIAGYKVAGLLAPTLANTSASIKDELHKLAAEVADKIESYSFEGDA